jgi:hypothetical protein
MGDDYDAAVAVTAHGLLASIGAILGAARTLQLHDGALSAEDRAELFRIIDDQGQFTMGTLRDLIQGMPQEAVHLLELISAETAGSPSAEPSAPVSRAKH